ncbi:MAG: hypothetical protein J6X03_05170, partial [Bacilli bacterium]|nr:hypothetical protein [Bacilli bacterium]
LANARIAFDMHIGLSHTNIFLLDNGQPLTITENGAKADFYNSENINTEDIMIDGIGVGDVVSEIITERNRLSEDGVAVFACAVSKSTREIIAGPDVQMRGFLFLKDKEADILLKEMSNMFVEAVNSWAKDTVTFATTQLTEDITTDIGRFLLRNSNRKPLVVPNIIVVD